MEKNGLGTYERISRVQIPATLHITLNRPESQTKSTPSTEPAVITSFSQEALLASNGNVKFMNAPSAEGSPSKRLSHELIQRDGEDTAQLVTRFYSRSGELILETPPVRVTDFLTKNEARLSVAA